MNILTKTTVRPVLGIITGSGLGGLADRIDAELEIPYKSIPDFPECTGKWCDLNQSDHVNSEFVFSVHGHAGSLVFGSLGGVPTVCMKGRLHVYEGYPPWKCTVPVRVMKLLGVKMLILTNAAGGMSSDFQTGDFMILKDHLSFPTMYGFSPLIGPNDDRWGPRFPLITAAYDAQLRQDAIRIAGEMGLAKTVHEGVYAYMVGPEFEGEAEVRALKMLGADAIGMSTVPETIVARHCGLKVLAISLITDMVNVETSHEDVLKVSKNRSVDLGRLLFNIAKHLSSTL